VKQWTAGESIAATRESCPPCGSGRLFGDGAQDFEKSGGDVDEGMAEGVKSGGILGEGQGGLQADAQMKY